MLPKLNTLDMYQISMWHLENLSDRWKSRQLTEEEKRRAKQVQQAILELTRDISVLHKRNTTQRLMTNLLGYDAQVQNNGLPSMRKLAHALDQLFFGGLIGHVAYKWKVFPGIRGLLLNERGDILVNPNVLWLDKHQPKS